MKRREPTLTRRRFALLAFGLAVTASACADPSFINPGRLASTLGGGSTPAQSGVLSYIGATGTLGSVGVAMSVLPTTITFTDASIPSSCALDPSFLPNVSFPSGLSIHPVTCAISGSPTTPVLTPTAFQILATSSTGIQTTGQVTLQVTAGAATQLAFTLVPSGTMTAGNTFASQPVVEFQDVSNTLASTTASVTIELHSNASCTSLVASGITGTASVAAVGGTVTFSGLGTTKAGTFYLKASSGGLNTCSATSFTSDAAAASQLAYAAAPTSETAGTAFGTQPVIQVRDTYSNTVASASGTMTLSLFSDSGCTTTPISGISAGSTASISSGVATFSGFTVTNANNGGSIYIKASDGTRTQCSSAVVVSAATASQLAYTTQPGSGTAGTALATQPVAEVRDTYSNKVSASGTMTLSLFSDSGCTTTPITGISAGSTASISSGVATFAGLTLTNSNSGASIYVKTSDGTRNLCSSAITVAAAGASQLAFTTQPGSGTAGTTLVIQPVVEVRDTFSNKMSSASGTMTLSLFSDSGCTTTPITGISAGSTASISSGVATFAGLTLTNSNGGANIYVKASDGTRTQCSSVITTAAATASQLAFTAQPGSGAAGTALATQPTLQVRDTYSNTVTSASGTMTLSLFSDSGCTTTPIAGISAGSTATISSGAVAFSGLTLTNSNVGASIYVKASDGTRTLCSSAITIAAATASQLAYTTQPGSGTAGTALATQPVVEVRDTYTNRTSASGTMTLALFSDSGCTTTPITGISAGSTASISSGVATFAGLTITNSNNGASIYVKTSDGTRTQCSSAITLTTAAASQLAYTTQPGSGTAGTALSTQPVVEVRDSFSNKITSASGTMTLTLFSDSGCTTTPITGISAGSTATITSGVATFAGLTLTNSNTGASIYIKTSDGTRTQCSTAITIAAAAASQLAYTTQPGSGTAGTALATQPVVEVRDTYLNRIASASGTMTLSLFSDSGCTTTPATGISAGGTASISSGVATFAGLTLIKSNSGANLYVKASDGTSTQCSSAITIAPASASQLAYTTQPGSGTAGTVLATQPVVEVRDTYNNKVSSASGTMTLTLFSDSGCTTTPVTGISAGSTASISSGVATFAGLTLTNSNAGASIYVKASDGTWTKCSTAATIAAAAASQLANTTQPGSGTAGTALATQPVVEVRDTYSNKVTSASGTMTLSLFSDSGCTTTPITGISAGSTATITSGVATFAGLIITNANAGASIYIKSSDGTRTQCSTAITIATAAASQLAYTTQPGSGTAGTALPTQPVVEVRDTYSNKIASASGTMTASLYSDSGCTTTPISGVSAGSTATITSGVASFSTLTLSNANGGASVYVKSSDGTRTQCSNALTVSVGSPASITIASGNSLSATAGSALSGPMTVTVQDVGGNLLTGVQVDWAVTSGTGTLGSGASSSTDGSGVASNTLTVGSAGTITVSATIHLTAFSVSFSETGNAPAAPTALAGTLGDASASLTWTAVSGATYKVYRSTTNGSGYAFVNTSATNSFSDTGLTNGTTYYYVVTSLIVGVESANSNQATVRPAAAPGVPLSLAGVPGNGTLTLSWAAPATGTAPFTYNVSRSSTTGGPYSPLATAVSGNTYPDSGLTSGTSYFYIVTATNTNSTGAASAELVATPEVQPTLAYDFSLGTLNPTVGATALSFSRASIATYFDSQGTLRYANQNLLPYSEQAQMWSLLGLTVTQDAATAPNGTSTADLLQETTANSDHMNGGDFTVIAGHTYTASIYLKTYPGSNSGGSLGLGNGAVWPLGATPFLNVDTDTGAIYDNIGGIAVTSTIVGNGWIRFSITQTAAASGTASFFFTRGGSAHVGLTSEGWYQWGGQVEDAGTPGTYVSTGASTYQGPRFDHDPVTHAARGLLTESASTNIHTYSTDFSKWSRITNATITIDQTTSPMGLTDADIIKPTTFTSTATISRSFSKTAASQERSFSVFAKAGGSTQITVQLGESTFANGVSATFDLSGGTAGSISTQGSTFSNGVARIQNVGNGWYRCMISAISGTEATVATKIVVAAAASAGGGVYLWGGQHENSIWATSYIPTGRVAVTRAADLVAFPNASIATGSTGSYLIDAMSGKSGLNGSFPASSYPFFCSDGTANNFLGLQLPGATNGSSLFSNTSGGVSQFNLSSAAASYTLIPTKIAAAFQAGSSAISVNGGTSVATASGSLPTGMTGCWLGASGTGSLGGWIKSFKSYATRITDADLQRLSQYTPSAPAPTNVLSYSGATGTVASVGSPMSVQPTTLYASDAGTFSNCALDPNFTSTTSFPTGLVINSTTCAVTGTPLTPVVTPTAFQVLVTTSTGGQVTAQVTLQVTAGSTTHLSFVSAPSGFFDVATALNPIVRLLDGSSALVNTTASISLELHSNASCTALVDGALMGDLTQAAVAGEANFSNVIPYRIGTYYLRAVSGTLSICSPSFIVQAVGPALLTFYVQPNSGTVGTALTTQPVVRVADQFFNVVSSETGTMTLSLWSDSDCSSTSIGGISAGSTASISSGVATFSGLTITNTNSGANIYIKADNGTFSQCSEPITIN